MFTDQLARTGDSMAGPSSGAELQLELEVLVAVEQLRVASWSRS